MTPWTPTVSSPTTEPSRPWGLLHVFARGYGWVRVKDGKREVVMWSDLPDRLTPQEFIRLKAWRQDAIVADLDAKLRAVRAEWAALPPTTIVFDRIKMPTIKSGFPEKPFPDWVRDLCDAPPQMQRRPR